MTLSSSVVAHLRSQFPSSCLTLMLSDIWSDHCKKDDQGRILLPHYDADSFALIVKRLERESLERHLAEVGPSAIPVDLRAEYVRLSDMLGLPVPEKKQQRFPLELRRMTGSGTWDADAGELTTEGDAYLKFSINTGDQPLAFCVEASSVGEVHKGCAEATISIQVRGRVAWEIIRGFDARPSPHEGHNNQIACYRFDTYRVGIGVGRVEQGPGGPKMLFHLWRDWARWHVTGKTHVRVHCSAFGLWKKVRTRFTFTHGDSLEACVKAIHP